MQFVVCSVQCAVCSVQCAVCSVNCVMTSVQWALCSVHFAVFSLQCAVPIIAKAGAGAGEEQVLLLGEEVGGRILSVSKTGAVCN